MMKKYKKDDNAIEAEVQKTLRSLDQIEKVKAPPFFYMRLQRKLETMQSRETTVLSERLYAKFFRPVLAPALIAASILLGVWIGRGTSSSSDKRSAPLTALATAYGLNTLNVSDYTLTEGK